MNHAGSQQFRRKRSLSPNSEKILSAVDNIIKVTADELRLKSKESIFFKSGSVNNDSLTMSLQQLIEELRPAQNIGWNHGVIEKIKNILSSKPELLKELDFEAVSKLLWKVLLENFKFDTEIIELFRKHESNLNPLQEALFYGDIELAEYLLKNGEKLEGSEWYVSSLLNCIFSRQNIFCSKDLLILLIKYGFDTGFHNSEGENLLHIFFEHFASKYNYSMDALEITEVLINSGVSITEVDHEGWPFYSLHEM